MNFYGISKFTAKITKETLEILFICVYGYSNNPLGFCFFQPEVPGRVREGEAVVDRRIRRLGSPAARNRWGKRERRPRRSSRYPWFAERRPEMGGPWQTGRRRRRQTTARVLQ